MIGSLLLGNAKYTIRQYIHVALIVGGTAAVSMSGKSKPGAPSSAIGLAFLAAALAFTFVMGEAGPGYKFLSENPAIFKDILKFAACSACGQAFIFYTISKFDSLVCTTVTTTRKVFSVLYSILMKGHVLNEQGWAGIAMACGGILGELEEKYSEGKKAATE